MDMLNRLEKATRAMTAQRDEYRTRARQAEAEVAQFKRERADLREKFWRELYGLPNPTEIMKRFDRAAEMLE